MSEINIEIQNPTIQVVLDAGEITVNLNDSPISVNLPMGATGPTGPQGPEGGSALTYPAGQNLSAGRVVVITAGEAFYFQPATIAHAGRTFGLTITSATMGNNIDVQLSGEVQDAALSFAPDKTLWVGNDGEIFDTIQAGAGEIHQKAGISTGLNKMKIDFSIQIIKS